nr:DegT/DnrJ/EryC1/StrS family aminotransferase [Xylanibacillus composti]
MPFIDLQHEWKEQEKEIQEAFSRVLKKGAFILGDEVRKLEEEVAAQCGATYGIGVGNGTDALVLHLYALGIGPGDEVITSPFTFFATAEAIMQVGAVPVFADVRPDTFNLDAEDAARRITPRTKAILPVHLFGQMADMTAIVQLADAHRLLVLEDACQAIGAQWEGRGPGAVSQGASFSFFPTKNLGTCGDGGMIVVNDRDMAERLRRLRVHGSRQKYHHDEIGWNSRLDEVHAAILRVKLKRLNAWNEQRREIAALYDSLLNDLPVTVPVVDARALPVYHLYTIQAERRDELQAHLNSKGISCGVYYPVPLYRQEALRKLGYKEGEFPHTEDLVRSSLSLPMFPGMTSKQAETVAAQIRQFYEGS